MPADPKEIAIALQTWAKGVKASIQGAFAAGGHQLHGGTKWAPLADSTIKAKGHSLPLIRTGALSRSIFLQVAGVTAWFSTRKDYAVYHQNGTRTVPQREVIVVSKQDMGNLKTEIKRRVEAP
jgi:phage gpG-like protein